MGVQRMCDGDAGASPPSLPSPSEGEGAHHFAALGGSRSVRAFEALTNQTSDFARGC